VIFCPQEVPGDFLALTWADCQQLFLRPLNAAGFQGSKQNLLMAAAETPANAALLIPQVRQ
jgi:hypothetical protein